MSLRVMVLWFLKVRQCEELGPDDGEWDGEPGLHLAYLATVYRMDVTSHYEVANLLNLPSIHWR